MRSGNDDTYVKMCKSGISTGKMSGGENFATSTGILKLAVIFLDGS